jgi:hypothetical protein
VRRFLSAIAASTGETASAPAPAPAVPAASPAPAAAAAPTAEGAKTFPLEDRKPGAEPR